MVARARRRPCNRRTVGRDDARHGGNDLEEAELVDVLLQGLAGARLAPAVARRVVVQADAVLRAEKLVSAVVEAVILEVDRFAVQGRRECGEAGQVGGVLELDDRPACGRGLTAVW